MVLCHVCWLPDTRRVQTTLQRAVLKLPAISYFRMSLLHQLVQCTSDLFLCGQHKFNTQHGNLSGCFAILWTLCVRSCSSVVSLVEVTGEIRLPSKGEAYEGYQMHQWNGTYSWKPRTIAKYCFQAKRGYTCSINWRIYFLLHFKGDNHKGNLHHNHLHEGKNCITWFFTIIIVE